MLYPDQPARQNSIMFVGTDREGVFRSSDRGDSWETVSDGLAAVDVWSFVWDAPRGILYAGTLDGVFLSADEEAPWKTAGNMGLPRTTVVALALDEGNGTLFAAISQTGIYRSSDGGTNWQQVTGEGLLEIEVQALTWRAGRLYAGTSGGIFESVDGGESWQGLSGEGLTSSYVRALLWQEDILYAGTPIGVFISTDGGASWQQTDGQGLTNTEVEALAWQNGYLYASTPEGLFRSPDGGTNWQLVTSRITNLQIRALQAVNDSLYAGTFAGVLRSDNGGIGWDRSNEGLPYNRVEALALHPQSNALYAGTLGGVYRSLDQGNSWQAINSGMSIIRVLSLALNPQEGTLYAGTTYEVYQFDEEELVWLTTRTGWPDQARVEALVFDRNGTLYAGTDRAGVLRFLGEGWVSVGSGLPAESFLRALVLDERDGTLYVGTTDGVFRLPAGGETWQAVSDGLEGHDVRALVLDERDGTLYAGTSGGVFRSTDGGQSWQSASQGLVNLNVLSLAMDPQEGTLYAGTDLAGMFRSTDGGQSWQAAGDELANVHTWSQAFWPEPSRVEVAIDALEELRRNHPDMRDGKVYPWRLILSPATGLLVFLRLWLPTPLSAEVTPKITDLLTTEQLRAIFGLRDNIRDILERELLPGPVISTSGPGNGDRPPIELQIRHFTWRQVYDYDGETYPVIGGSVRVHGVLDDERIAVTSSYFPIPPNYPFSPNSSPAGDSLTPNLSPEEAALEAVVLASQAAQQPCCPFLAALVNRMMLRGDVDALRRWVPVLEAELSGWRRWLVSGVRWLLQHRALAWLGMFLWPLVWGLTGLVKQAAKVVPMPIYGSEYAILPFDGAYHLVNRFQVEAKNDIPWHIEIDMKTDKALGEPWQAFMAADYYKKSREAIPDLPDFPDGHPSGDTTVIDVAELNQYVIGLPLSSIDELELASRETRTVAAHIQGLYSYLQNTCGVQENQLHGDDVSKLTVDVDSDLSTRFIYSEPTIPKIRFERDPLGNGIEMDNNLKIYTPARDPEVILHEFVHGFMWLLNRDPWDTWQTLSPFGLALHEGYAIYLSRSVAAGDDDIEAGQPWARATYRDWGGRWEFIRPDKMVGADLLPAPNTYPAGSYSTASLEVYDVGMVWARALWDLRRLLGRVRTDWLAVQAFFYLHGYIANFELTAEGILDADSRLTNTDLANGTQPLWAERGIAAGQGAHSIAQASDGTLIAASDAGIVKKSPDHGNQWLLETNNLAGGSTLTGVVAVAAHNNTFYAAAQLPPPPSAGNNTQWRPGVYKKGTSDWQPVGNWSGETSDATPLSILTTQEEADGVVRIFVGTSRGVYYSDGGVWQSVSNLDEANNSFTVVDFVHITASGFPLLRACTPNSLRQISAVDLQEGWSLPSGANPFASESTRPTAMVNWNGTAYVSTLTDGLWQIEDDFATTSIYDYNTTGTILALATSNRKLYFATPEAIYHTASPDSSPQQLSEVGFPSNALVISLHITPTGDVLVGTLAHGIWQYHNNNWEQVYTPPFPNSIQLAADEQLLISCCAQPVDNHIRINLSTAANDSVRLLQAAQPGFPLRLADNPQNDNGVYNLSFQDPIQSGPFILRWQNITDHLITLDVLPSGESDVININVS